MSLETSEPREQAPLPYLNEECAVDRTQGRAFWEGRRQLRIAWRVQLAQGNEPGAGKTPEQEAPEPKTSHHPLGLSVARSGVDTLCLETGGLWASFWTLTRVQRLGGLLTEKSRVSNLMLTCLQGTTGWAQKSKGQGFLPCEGEASPVPHPSFSRLRVAGYPPPQSSGCCSITAPNSSIYFFTKESEKK